MNETQTPKMHVDDAHTLAMRLRKPVTREFTAVELNAMMNAVMVAQHFNEACAKDTVLAGLVNGWMVAE